MTKNDHIWSSEELLSQHIQAVASALDDPEIPVKVQAILTLTEMVIVYESGRFYPISFRFPFFLLLLTTILMLMV